MKLASPQSNAQHQQDQLQQLKSVQSGEVEVDVKDEVEVEADHKSEVEVESSESSIVSVQSVP